jgi:NAD(P)-dependent dehydrogenase (short-subunit alcohol dehydrogenase family)
VENSLFDLCGRVAVVTGGGSGLGRVYCEAMAKYGADVVCVGRTEPKLKGTVDIISRYGHRAVAAKADVSRPDEVEDMVNKVVAEFGKIDILFNNAGVAGAPTRIGETPIEEWDRIIATDLRGVFLCMRAVLPVMAKQKKGSIINISSIGGFGGADPEVAPAAYGASKAAVNVITKYAAVEYAKDGVRVNCIAPGMHPTGFEQAMGITGDELAKHMQALYDRNIPMARGGKPSEMEGLAVFLASDASSFITGQVIIQDGGQLAKI